MKTNLLFQVQHSPFWGNLAFVCNTETIGSLYSYALLILTKSFNSKNQVVHGQKFKDLLSSTCKIRPEEECWTLNQRSRVQYSLGVTFCYSNLVFSHGKASDANIDIIPNFV